MILGALLGLVGSIIPEVIKILRDRQSHKQELERLKLEIEHHQKIANIRMQEAKELASIEIDKSLYNFATPKVELTGKTWIDAIQVLASVYNQTVRPTITYMVILGWLLYKYALWQIAGGSISAIPSIWNDNDNEFVSAVVAFWFGSRAFKRTFER